MRVVSAKLKEVALALNVARQHPRHFIPLVTRKSPREGASLIADAADFLRNVTLIPGLLRPNPPLSMTCAEAICLLGREAARHTRPRSKFVRSRGYCAGAFGEVSWSSGTAPRSGVVVVTDLLPGNGAPSRSHRTGILDADFREVRDHAARTLYGETAAFLHFRITLYALRFMSREFFTVAPITSAPNPRVPQARESREKTADESGEISE